MRIEISREAERYRDRIELLVDESVSDELRQFIDELYVDVLEEYKGTYAYSLYFRRIELYFPHDPDWTVVRGDLEHELQHARDDREGRIEHAEWSTPLEYFKQPHEKRAWVAAAKVSIFHAELLEAIEKENEYLIRCWMDARKLQRPCPWTL